LELFENPVEAFNEPIDSKLLKNTEIMRKFSEIYAKKSNTKFC
jgi:hypothetical protein